MTSNAPASRDFRVALVGYGTAGSVFHAPLITATPGLSLDFVVTGNAERAARIGEQYPGTAVLSGMDAVLDVADEVDLLVLATPNSHHAEQAIAALRAGLPVVVDKPFTPTAEEAHAVIAEALERDLMLTVFHNRRWDNDMRTLQRLLNAGELGHVRRFESRFERWVPTPKPGWREGGDPAEAGGVLYDLGSHLIDQALVLFGPVQGVYAEIDARRPGSRVDDDCFVALTHLAGVRSHLWMSKAAPQHGPRLRVLGDIAGYTKHGVDPQEQWLRDGAAATARLGEEPEENWGMLGVEGDEWPVPTEHGNYLGFYAAVVASLRDGVPAPVEPVDAVAGLEVIAAARRSAREGTVVNLG